MVWTKEKKRDFEDKKEFENESKAEGKRKKMFFEIKWKKKDRQMKGKKEKKYKIKKIIHIFEKQRAGIQGREKR